jgi:hypothetical protein
LPDGKLDLLHVRTEDLGAQKQDAE